MENKRCVSCGMEYPNHKMSCKDSVKEYRLPTAEEILKETDAYSHIDDGGDKVFYSGFVESLMIEFAKLHVEAALKAASELEESNGTEGYKIYPNSILNSYPLDKIK